MKTTAAKSPQTVDEYIALQPEVFRPQLQKLRALIKQAAPNAIEKISYGVPCFFYHYMLVGIGVTKKYCSLYAMSPALLKHLKVELHNLRIAGSTLHFEPNEPLPEAVIKEAVLFRVQQNEAKATAKNKKIK